MAPFGKGDKPTIGFCVGMTEAKPERKVKRIAQVLDEEPILTGHLLKLSVLDGGLLSMRLGSGAQRALCRRGKKLAGTWHGSDARIGPRRAPARSVCPICRRSKRRCSIICSTHPGPIQLRQVKEATACGGMPIEAVVEKGYARRFAGASIRRPPFRKRSPRPGLAIPATPAPTLTADQLAAWEHLEPALKVGGFQPFLLYGITGSGKTELYLKRDRGSGAAGEGGHHSRSGNQPDAADDRAVSRALRRSGSAAQPSAHAERGSTGGASPAARCR